MNDGISIIFMFLNLASMTASILLFTALRQVSLYKSHASSITYPLRFLLERWLSGRRHVPAKDAYLLTGTVGSNPTLSDLLLI